MDKCYGLIFDVDGVIADTEAVNARASIKMFSELFGVEAVQRKDFEAGLGRGAEEYIKAAARVYGMELTAEQLTQAVNARQENFLDILKRFNQPMRRFIKDSRSFLGQDFPNSFLARARFYRQVSFKDEPVGGCAGQNQGID